MRSWSLRAASTSGSLIQDPGNSLRSRSFGRDGYRQARAKHVQGHLVDRLALRLRPRTKRLVQFLGDVLSVKCEGWVKVMLWVLRSYPCALNVCSVPGRWPPRWACPIFRGTNVAAPDGATKGSHGRKPVDLDQELNPAPEGRQRAVSFRGRLFRPSGAARRRSSFHGLAPVAIIYRPYGTCGFPEFRARPPRSIPPRRERPAILHLPVISRTRLFATTSAGSLRSDGPKASSP